MDMFIPEFLGCTCMMLLGISSSYSISHSQALPPHSSLMRETCWSVALMLGMLVALPHRVQLNPVVTIALAYGGELSWTEVIPILIAQVLGCVTGGCLAFVPHMHSFKTKERVGSELYVFEGGNGHWSARILGEVFASFLFVYMIRTFTTNIASVQGYDVLVSLTYMAVTVSFGCNINPAIRVGGLITRTLLPCIQERKQKKLVSWILDVVILGSSIIGGIIAMIVFGWFHG